MSKGLNALDISVEDLDLDAAYEAPKPNEEIDDDQGKPNNETIQGLKEDPKGEQGEGDDPKPDDEGESGKKVEPDPSTSDDPNEDPDSSSDDDLIVAILADKLGVELSEEDLEQYGDDYDDIAKFIENFGTKLAEEHITEELGAIPDVLQYYKHRKSGGKSEDFFNVNTPAVDYASIDLETADNATLRQMVSENLKLQGVSDEQVKATVEGAEASGFLKVLAGTAKESLAKYQADAKKNLADTIANREEEKRIAAEKFEKSVDDALEKNSDFVGITLSTKDKKELRKYVLEPIDASGKTQYALDGAKTTLEQKLAVAELMRRGFDFTTIVDKAANTKNARKLKDRLRKQKDDAKNSKSTRTIRSSSANSIDVNDLDTGT